MINIDGVKYYSKEEVMAQLNISKHGLEKYCLCYDIKAKRYQNGSYLSETDLNKITNEEPIYTNINDFATRYKVNPSSVTKLILANNISKQISSGTNSYYLMTDLEKLLPNLTGEEHKHKRLLAIENGYAEMSELYALFDDIQTGSAVLSEPQVKMLVDIDDKDIKEYKTLFPDDFKRISHVTYYNCKILDYFLDKGKRSFNKKDYFHSTHVKETFEWTDVQTREMLRIAKMKGYRYGNNKVVYRTDQIEELKRLNEEYISWNNVCLYFQVSPEEMNKFSTKYEKFRKDSGKFAIYKKEEIFPIIQKIIDDEKIRREKLAEKRRNSDMSRNANRYKTIDSIKNALNIYKDKYPKTVKYMKEFIEFRYKKSKAKSPIKNSIVDLNAALEILKTIDKEIIDYTTEELKSLTDKLTTQQATRVLSGLSGYILTNNYSCKYTLPLNYTNEYVHSEPYGEEEWAQFRKDLNNLAVHIPFAEASAVYAQMWLFAISHTFLAWRASDFAKLPRPRVIIENEDGKITEEDAVIIAMDIREQVNTDIASKNEKELQFPEVPRPMLLAFAIAVLICDMHKKDDVHLGEVGLIRSSNISTYAALMKRCGFLNNINGFRFKSLRANKTIETGVWIKAATMPDIGITAFTMAAVMRSHTHDNLTNNDTTPVYIMPTSAFTSEVQIAITNRGLFGFNSQNLLNIMTYGNAKALDFLEETKAITAINELLPPSISEPYAQLMLKHVHDEIDFCKEWEINGEEMERNILKALNSDGGSRFDGIVCTRGWNCEKVLADPSYCIECSYGMMTLQMAAEIGRKTMIAFNQLKMIGEPKTEAEKNTKILLERKLASKLALVKLIKDNAPEGKIFASVMNLDDIQKEVKLLQ